jgi:hypothetical protein
MKLTFDYLHNPDDWPIEYDDLNFKKGNQWYYRFKKCSTCINCVLADELIFHIICHSKNPEWTTCFSPRTED